MANAEESARGPQHPGCDPVPELRAGNESAFREYFGPELDGAWTFVSGGCRGDEDLTLRATRTAFLLAWARVGELSGWDQFRVWLYAVARSQAQIEGRSGKRTRHQEMLTVTPPPGDVEALIDTAISLLNTEDRELVELTYRHRFDAAQTCRIIGRPLNPHAAERQVSKAQAKLIDALAALLLFVDAPACEQRQRDIGRDTGFNPLTRTRLTRHARSCQACAPYFENAQALVESVKLGIKAAPEQLRRDLFEPTSMSGEAQADPRPTGETSGTARYLGLGPAALPELTAWQKAQRIAKSVPSFGRDGWPPARPPGRMRRLVARS